MRYVCACLTIRACNGEEVATALLLPKAGWKPLQVCEESCVYHTNLHR